MDRTSDATSGSSAAFDDPLQIPLWRQLPPASISKTPHGTWAILDSSPAAQSLRNKFAELGVLVTEPEDNPTELHGVVTLAHAHDGPVDAVTSFSQAAGHLVPHVVDGGLWVSVTYNGSDPAHSGTVDPVAAAVRALPRVLGQESPGLRWAAVDLDIDIAHEEGADVVLSEIRDALGRSDTQPAPQVTVRAGTRWTSGTTSWSAAEPAAGVQPRTRALIVGGTGAVGRLLSRHLSQRGYDVVVTSRREPTNTESTPVRHVVSNATDADDFAAVVASLDAEGHPIGLIIHAAGVAATVAPVTLTAYVHEAARAHIDAKLTVARNIHLAVSALAEDRRPASILCMSSATGMLGGVGMARTPRRTRQWTRTPRRCRVTSPAGSASCGTAGRRCSTSRIRVLGRPP